MRRIGGRDIVAAILIALVAGAVFTSPPLQTLQGLSLDILTALRWQACRRSPRSRDIAGRRRGHRRRDLRHPALQGIADADLDARDRPGARQHHRRRRQGRSASTSSFQARSSSRKFPSATRRSAPHERALTGTTCIALAATLRRRQARARRDPQQRPSGAALPRATTGGADTTSARSTSIPTPTM